MVDFHSHILPGIDDGSDSVETSLAMLRESWLQGVDILCATPHFYADEEDPDSFLDRRAEAWDVLRDALGDSREVPDIRLGAEVLYFPGISVAEDVSRLRLEGTPFLLVEPPMAPWTDAMLEEIEECGHTLRCIPVIAHIDRYMRMLGDRTLLDRTAGRRLLVQVNASFFLRRQSRDFAVACLRRGRIHFLGSDCHDLRDRPPNLGDAVDVIFEASAEDDLLMLNERAISALRQKYM